MHLSDANRKMSLTTEGIQQTKEGLEIFKRLSDMEQWGDFLIILAWLFCADNQLKAAEQVISCMHNLFSEKGDQYGLCGSHCILSETCQFKGETKKAIHHYEAALGVMLPFNWHDELCEVDYSLVGLFHNYSRFDEANCHRHGHLTRLSLNSFFYFAKSNSSYPLVNLILSYPSSHVHYPTFLIFLLKCAGLFYDAKQAKGTAVYLYEGGWC